MTTAPEYFEKWWQAAKLGGFNGNQITADHVRQAYDAGVQFARSEIKAICDAEVDKGYEDRHRESLTHRDGGIDMADHISATIGQLG